MLVAVGALVVMLVVLVVVGSRTEPHRRPERFVATELPATPVGRQMRWLIAASTRLPLSEQEWRAHLAKELLALPDASPAQLNKAQQMGTHAEAVRLLGLTVVQPDALAAIVMGRDAREFVVMVSVDRTGMIKYLSFEPSVSGPEVTLPAPTGSSAVGTYAVALSDPARGGRRLMLTLWYPAASVRGRPLAVYASPRLTATLGLPPVRVHARERAPARRARLPVVLFSPGFGAPRVLYQALAEDLASHGYLVIAVDHTGEAPVEFRNGDIQLPSVLRSLTSIDLSSLAAASATRLADMRLILQRLYGTSNGPHPDPGRIAVVGHSIGGSTAAAVMRAEPRVDVGVDIDGSILGSATRRGVTRPSWS